MATPAIVKPDRKPIISFGLITDIHYADNDDRWNFSKTFIRRYRNALKLVNQACDYWSNHSYPISFLIQLGDIIDGICETNKTSDVDLQTILKEFGRFSTIYHLWGNHELYNFKRKQLLNGPLCSFNTEMISPSHYGTIEVCSKLKILAIDTYELSLLGVDKESELYRQALNYFQQHNPNEKVNDWNGLEGFQRRFTQLNGALTTKQLDWLKEELTKARNLNENVLIIGHIPIHPEAGDELALLWNYEEVIDVLWTYNDVVLAYLAGHCHGGGYICDEKNIHHITFQAIVECQPDTNAFATVHVYEECMLIEGVGKTENYRIELKKKI